MYHNMFIINRDNINRIDIEFTVIAYHHNHIIELRMVMILQYDS